jgi:DNA-directed RNA polymerase subunit L
MEEQGFKKPFDMLPSAPWYDVSFILHNSNSAFANAVRRALVEEVECRAFHCEYADIETDDDFISGLVDVLQKNINLLPAYQTIDKEKLSLNVVNASNVMLRITSGHFENWEKVFPHGNILIASLRPGKYLKIKNVHVVRGNAVENAGKFTLLNNVTYEPLNVVPYDQFTRKGVRAAETEYKDFRISFTTASNIEPITVIERVCDAISADLLDMKEKISLYAEAADGDLYSGFDCHVEKVDDVTKYTFINVYLTACRAVAAAVYELDNSIPFITATVERYDMRNGVIRINHVEKNKILLKAIQVLLEQLDTLKKSF